MPRVCLILFVLSLTCAPVRAEMVQMPACADTTLYDEGDWMSNGWGQHFFAGKTPASLRRAPIRFDVEAALPPGSTILTAEVILNLSRTKSGPREVALHRLLASWGEEGSDAAGQEGGGAQALPGDATWVYREWPTLPWTMQGGDFAALASDVISVGGPCLPENGQTAACKAYRWGSTPQMVADVQSWLDAPSQNHGWILVGAESFSGSAKRFDSRTHPDPADRPLLRVVYEPPTQAGEVPDGAQVAGEPLTVERLPGGEMRLAWDPSCVGGDEDYQVYAGSLGASFDYDHSPVTCTTAGATAWTLPLGGSSAYYLVVPHNGAVEGSYGRAGDGASRPPASAPCRIRSFTECL